MKIIFPSLFLSLLFSQQITVSWSMQKESNVQDESPRQYYDLKENIVYNLSTFQSDNIPYTKHAYVADEKFPLSPQFLEQTQKMVKRELAFRHKCNIAEGTNIAQLCIYGIYDDNDNWKFTEIFNPKSCKGHFYLSGNEPVSLLPSPDKKINATFKIDIQKISHEKGYIEVRQRPQPHLAGIISTLDFLENIPLFIENPTKESKSLALQAQTKKKKIKALIEQKNRIIEELEQEVTNFTSSTAQPDTLTHSACKFMTGILQELITCLEKDDFNFYGMKDAIRNTNLKDFIQSIQKKLSTPPEDLLPQEKLPTQKLSDIFNSKHFNLGCSEPLLLFDLLDDELSKIDLIKKIKNDLLNENLNSIVVQLHSTKTPCRSCLIGCCGHLHSETGIIKSFFNEIKESISEKSKKDVKLYFLISYHDPYEEDYAFYSPVTLEFIPNSILLVNMEFFDEKNKKMKQRIIKEHLLQIKSALLKKLQEEDKILTTDDINKL